MRGWDRIAGYGVKSCRPFSREKGNGPLDLLSLRFDPEAIFTLSSHITTHCNNQSEHKNRQVRQHEGNPNKIFVLVAGKVGPDRKSGAKCYKKRILSDEGKYVGHIAAEGLDLPIQLKAHKRKHESKYRKKRWRFYVFVSIKVKKKLGSDHRAEPDGSAAGGVRAQERQNANKYNAPVPDKKKREKMKKKKKKSNILN